MVIFLNEIDKRFLNFNLELETEDCTYKNCN